MWSPSLSLVISALFVAKLLSSASFDQSCSDQLLDARSQPPSLPLQDSKDLLVLGEQEMLQPCLECVWSKKGMQASRAKRTSAQQQRDESTDNNASAMAVDSSATECEQDRSRIATKSQI